MNQCRITSMYRNITMNRNLLQVAPQMYRILPGMVHDKCTIQEPHPGNDLVTGNVGIHDLN